MEDNLILIQQINLMIQKEGEELKGFNDVIHAAQQHIDSIYSIFRLGVSWLKDGIDLNLIQGKIFKIKLNFHHKAFKQICIIGLILNFF